VLPLTHENELLMLQRFAELVYLMLPAYCANMAPPFVKYWRGWNRPIARAWLGDHKTIVGFALGVLSGVLTALIQSRVDVVSPGWPRHQWLTIGLVMGLGAICGDALKSFFKRRVGIAPGQRWIPFDQLDFAIGALIPLSFMIALSWTDMLVILAFTFVADIVVNHLSFWIGIRNTKW
jgi:CDP-2,3-bis-(O-geranylgeranyl)-sn-glycerol synthase